MEHAFHHDFTLGVEEELLLVDPVTLELAPVAERVLPAIDAPVGGADHEAYAAELELRSPPCGTAGEAVAALRGVRTAAGAAGATLMGAGIHPAGRLGDARLVDSERYRKVDATMRGLIRRTPECALHVHVGMPDAETAVRAFNGLRAHLPLLQALSANSPFWFAEDSGMASARASLVRAYPGRGVPRAFASFDDYAEIVAASAAAAGASDYTYLWWDLRAHPRLGTIEVREMDAQSSLEDVVALAGLIHALAVREAQRPVKGTPAAPAEAIAWSSFRAARDGLEATILHEDELCPVPQVARAVLDAVRPVAGELGADLDAVERIVREGNGAARQRATHARGGMRAMLDALVERTR
jgi:glutamate---cysteine ligase / carboxylate-amine ligase